MMKKKEDYSEYWKEHKIRRREFLKFQRRYRLEHPVFNLLHKMDPIIFGLATCFFSGFFWFAMGGVPIIGMTATGVIGWLISFMVHKDFDKKKTESTIKKNQMNQEIIKQIRKFKDKQDSTYLSKKENVEKMKKLYELHLSKKNEA